MHIGAADPKPYLHALDAHARGVVGPLRRAVHQVLLVQQLVLVHAVLLLIISLAVVLWDNQNCGQGTLCSPR